MGSLGYIMGLLQGFYKVYRPKYMGSSLKQGSFWGSFIIRVPYYIADPKGDPSLENYPYSTYSNTLPFCLRLCAAKYFFAISDRVAVLGTDTRNGSFRT